VSGSAPPAVGDTQQGTVHAKALPWQDFGAEAENHPDSLPWQPAAEKILWVFLSQQESMPSEFCYTPPCSPVCPPSQISPVTASMSLINESVFPQMGGMNQCMGLYYPYWFGEPVV
jgi:hypothetical protein